MIPILITGSSLEARLAKAKSLISNIKYQISNFESHPDFLIISADPSIKIKQIRDLQIFLSRKPFQAKIKVVLLAEAEKMSVPAQNSFLKTLEEPPAHSLIVLCCSIKDQLLSTILSRCQMIRLSSVDETKIDSSLFTNHYSLITKLINSSAGRRLLLIEPYTKSREEAVKFCQEIILVLRQVLLAQKHLGWLAKPSSDPPAGRAGVEGINPKQFSNSPITNHQSLITNLKSFQHTLNLIKANINVKLSLDNFVLNLPKP